MTLRALCLSQINSARYISKRHQTYTEPPFLDLSDTLIMTCGALSMSPYRRADTAQPARSRAGSRHGTAVQVAGFRTRADTSARLWSQRLKLQYEQLLTIVAFKFNLRRYTMGWTRNYHAYVFTVGSDG